jgi:hypothetical protein
MKSTSSQLQKLLAQRDKVNVMIDNLLAAGVIMYDNDPLVVKSHTLTQQIKKLR